MKKVEHTAATLPELSKSDEDTLRRLAANQEAPPNDFPELSDAQLAAMQSGAFYRPLKKQITARVDADVLAWLKSQGKGYQSRMNAILREAMLSAK